MLNGKFLCISFCDNNRNHPSGDSGKKMCPSNADANAFVLFRVLLFYLDCMAEERAEIRRRPNNLVKIILPFFRICFWQRFSSTQVRLQNCSIHAKWPSIWWNVVCAFLCMILICSMEVFRFRALDYLEGKKVSASQRRLIKWSTKETVRRVDRVWPHKTARVNSICFTISHNYDNDAFLRWFFPPCCFHVHTPFLLRSCIYYLSTRSVLIFSLWTLNIF